MKKATIVLSTLFMLLFFSSCNNAGSQFIGTWKNKRHDSIEVNIKKEKGEFMVATLVNGKVSSTLPYKLKDNALTPEVVLFGGDNSISIMPSGRLSWEGIEWEKLN